MRHDIVVIGGSMGSTAVLKPILAAMPPSLPASVFVVVHLPTAGDGLLMRTLAKASSLPAAPAVDGEAIEPGRVYLAVPARHLLVIDSKIELGTGPRENMARPAIDALFRSAALAYGPRVIGVVLSGLLDDGASGLTAIKGCGGITVVQHPRDAEAPDMPEAALAATDVDHVAPAAELGGLVTRLVGTEADDAAVRCPPELDLDIRIARGRRLGSERLRSFAEPVPISCPDCGGVLSEVKGEGPLRFRCQIGHGFTAEALIEAHKDNVEEALEVAMRVMEERFELVARLARNAHAQGRAAVAGLYEEREKEYGTYATILRRALTRGLRAKRGRSRDADES